MNVFVKLLLMGMLSVVIAQGLVALIGYQVSAISFEVMIVLILFEKWHK